ncbi:hypothetical protein G6F66_013757 [Rhizopus arrhizus]|nr:hypothetical protein G6F66_013757 [Rhizopus arrhizus]
MRASASASLSSASACSWKDTRISSSTRRASRACSRSVGSRSDMQRAPPADAVVGQACRFHFSRVIQVAPVEHRRVLQLLAQLLEIGAAELLPLGHHHQRVGPLQRVIGTAAEHQVVALAEDPLRFMHGFRGVGTHGGAPFPELCQQATAGCRAHGVGIRRDCEAPHGKGLAAHAFILAPVVVTLDEGAQMPLLRFVDRLHRVQQLRLQAMLLGGAGQ